MKKKVLLDAWKHICTARAMSAIYEENAKLTSKYVHATSKGHEVAQIALGMQLLPQDYLFAYYRDDSILLSIGCSPFDLMLQLFAKKDDPFSGGRTYYAHPALNDSDKPKIPHQSSATGMQAIPSTGVALGLKYQELEKLVNHKPNNAPVVVCSLGDASVTEGEVSEAFQMAVLRELPILYFVQDNEWDISASADEVRAMDAAHYAKGFKGLTVMSIDGTDFNLCHHTIKKAIKHIRKKRKPVLVHVKVPLLNHHTSGVRMEWYRDDLEEAQARDPYPTLRVNLIKSGIQEETLLKIEEEMSLLVEKEFNLAMNAADPDPKELYLHEFSPTTITSESGTRTPENAEEKVMVDCALIAIQEIMERHPESLLYGQDVGGRLGGVFREAATLAQKFGDNRVFNTPIQEAFIVGSTVGLSAVGLKPIVEVQFADYIWPGLNQLFTEVSRSCYLSNGKWPVSMVLRVPTGAYGSGGPYHSSSVESVLCNIKGIKIVYPSNGADMKGLIKAAYYDPNPVVILEHKGLYWSKVPGTNAARTKEPSEDYIVPIGSARIFQQANPSNNNDPTLVLITYGMGVHWGLQAAKHFPGSIEILDLRSLYPLDTDMIYDRVNHHGRCCILTEEAVNSTFAQSIAGRIQEQCFESLDAPVRIIGSKNTPAIPLNSTLEEEYLPSLEQIAETLAQTLEY